MRTEMRRKMRGEVCPPELTARWRRSQHSPKPVTRWALLVFAYSTLTPVWSNAVSTNSTTCWAARHLSSGRTTQMMTP